MKNRRAKNSKAPARANGKMNQKMIQLPEYPEKLST
jgi:hypothetical protein